VLHWPGVPAGFLALTGIPAIVAFFQGNMLSAGFGLATPLIIAFVQFKNAVGAFLGNIS
jgi:hypothetical protein